MARYTISFDFDGEGDPPTVEICERGMVVAEVHEEPTCTAGTYSNNPDHWQPGPLALRIVAGLNGWIPADSDHFPDGGAVVLVVYREGRSGPRVESMGSYDMVAGQWWDHKLPGGPGRVTGVTHWRPFPSLPL